MATVPASAFLRLWLVACKLLCLVLSVKSVQCCTTSQNWCQQLACVLIGGMPAAAPCPHHPNQRNAVLHQDIGVSTWLPVTAASAAQRLHHYDICKFRQVCSLVVTLFIPFATTSE